MFVHTWTLKLNFRLRPLAEELGLEHSSLCSAVKKEGGRRALCDCSLEQGGGGVEEWGLAWWGDWRGVSGRKNSSLKHLSASSTTVNTPPSLCLLTPNRLPIPHNPLPFALPLLSSSLHSPAHPHPTEPRDGWLRLPTHKPLCWSCDQPALAERCPLMQN